MSRSGDNLRCGPDVPRDAEAGDKDDKADRCQYPGPGDSLDPAHSQVSRTVSGTVSHQSLSLTQSHTLFWENIWVIHNVDDICLFNI